MRAHEIEASNREMEFGGFAFMSCNLMRRIKDQRNGRRRGEEGDEIVDTKINV